jgi:sarcosine oxidase
MRADVVVVGLGSMGAATAAELATRGVRVVGVDRFTPPHDRGAHSGGSRIIRMAYMEGPAYVPLVRRAYDQWRDLERDTGVPLLTTTGGLMLGAPDSFAVGGALATARAENLPHELLDPAEVRRRFPAFTPAEHEVGLYEEIAGLVRPEAAIRVLLQRAQRYGGELRFGVTVHGWQASTSGVTVSTSGGDLHADRLVLAPGAWAPELTRLPVPMRVERRVQHYWGPADPSEYGPDRLPVWIWSYAEGLAAYGLAAIDGRVKAAMHFSGELVDPSVGADAARPDEIEAMRGWFHGRMPGLAAADWLGSTPCLYTLTPDEHFVLGHHPDHPQVAVACGFSGHGFKFVPVFGEILADLALDGRTRHDIALFDPTRFASEVPASAADVAAER